MALALSGDSGMHYASGRLVFSPSDLVVYMDGDYVAWMERWHLECRNGNPAMATAAGLPLGLTIDGITCVPDEPDAELKLIAAKGQEYEAAYLAKLRTDGHEVLEIASGIADDQKVVRTVEAMRAAPRLSIRLAFSTMVLPALRTSSSVSQAARTWAITTTKFAWTYSGNILYCRERECPAGVRPWKRRMLATIQEF